MANFTYEHYRSPYIGTAIDLIAHANDPYARAAEISGQARAAAAQGIGQAVGALPGQLAQGQRQGVVDERNRLQLTKEQQEVRDDQMWRAAMAKAEAAGGDMRVAVAFLKQQGAAGINALQKLTGLAQAQQAEHDDKAGELGYRLAKAGNTPDALQQLLTEYGPQGDRLLSAADVAHFTSLAQTDPSKLPQVSRDLMAKSAKFRPLLDQKVENAAPGSMARDPLTGQTIEGSQVPFAPQRPTVVGPGAIAVNPQTGATVATGPPKELVPKSLQSKPVLVDGKPAEAVFNPADGTWLVNGQPAEGSRIKPMPPASTQVNVTQQNEAKDIADAIIRGEQPPDVKGLYRLSGPVRAELAKQGYDMMKANLDWEATKKHLATLNGSKITTMRSSIATASESLDVIDDLAKKWDAGRFPILNKANLVLAKGGAYGKEAATIATQLEGQITDVVSELGQVYMGGNSPTDHALKLAEKNLSAAWDKKVLLDMTQLARTNLRIRNNSIVNSGAVLSTPQPQAPETAPQTAAPAMIEAKDPQGNIHHAPAGTPLPAGWVLVKR